MRDTVRKWMYLDPVDMEHFEAWLEAMAKKGLQFDHLSALGVVFRRGEPASIRYRLDPAGNLWTLENRDYCKSLGWEHIGQVGRYFDLYANRDPEAPELHTDPVVQSYGLEQIMKRVKRYCIGLAFATLLLLVAIFLPFFLTSTPVLTLLVDNPTSGNLPVLVFELLSLSITIRTYRAFFRLRQRLKEGQAPRRDKSWYAVVLEQRVLNWLALALTLLYIGILFAVSVLPWKGQLDGLNRPIPMLPLAELEGNPTLEPLVDDRWADGQDRNNYVTFTLTPVAPEQYEISQWLTDGDSYQPSLTIRWYRLSLPFLASPLLDDLAYRYTQYLYHSNDFSLRELSLPSFDRAILATDQHDSNQRLFLQKGAVVIYLNYYGEQNLTERPELLENLASPQN